MRTPPREANSIAAAAVAAVAATLFVRRRRRVGSAVEALETSLSAAEKEILTQCSLGVRIAMNLERTIASSEATLALLDDLDHSEVANAMLSHVQETAIGIVCSMTDLVGREILCARGLSAIRSAAGLGPSKDLPEGPDANGSPHNRTAEALFSVRRRAEALLASCERRRKTM